MASPHDTLVSVRTHKSGFQKKPLFIVVGKAVAKEAATRNLLKRRVRAIIRTLFTTHKSDITVMVRPAAAHATYAALKEAIHRALTNA